VIAKRIALSGDLVGVLQNGRLSMSCVCQASPSARGFTPHPREIWHRTARERASPCPQSLEVLLRRQGADNPFVSPSQYAEACSLRTQYIEAHGFSITKPGSGSIFRHGPDRPVVGYCARTIRSMSLSGLRHRFAYRASKFTFLNGFARA